MWSSDFTDFHITIILTWWESHTCSKKDDLIIQRQIREMRYSLGPLHQSKQLLICCMADISDWVICLRNITKCKEKERPFRKAEVNRYIQFKLYLIKHLCLEAFIMIYAARDHWKYLSLHFIVTRTIYCSTFLVNVKYAT